MIIAITTEAAALLAAAALFVSSAGAPDAAIAASMAQADADFPVAIGLILALGAAEVAAFVLARMIWRAVANLCRKGGAA